MDILGIVTIIISKISMGKKIIWSSLGGGGGGEGEATRGEWKKIVEFLNPHLSVSVTTSCFAFPCNSTGIQNPTKLFTKH